MVMDMWYKPGGPPAKAATGAKTDKVSELKRKLLQSRIQAGTASVDEMIAFNLAAKLEKASLKKKRKKGASSDDDEDAPKKKKKKKSKGSSDDDSDDATLFGQPLSVEGTGNPILKAAVTDPGNLYRSASLAAAKATGATGRGAGEAALYAASGDQWMTYLHTILAPRYPAGIPIGIKRELQTLAAALAHLAKGEVGELGDMLVQRLKSLELGLSGNDSAALAVQLVDLHETGLTSHQELSVAQAHQKALLKLAEQQQRLG